MEKSSQIDDDYLDSDLPPPEALVPWHPVVFTKWYKENFPGLLVDVNMRGIERKIIARMNLSFTKSWESRKNDTVYLILLRDEKLESFQWVAKSKNNIKSMLKGFNPSALIEPQKKKKRKKRSIKKSNC